MLLNCGVGEDSLRVPWTARRSNQSILKEINPEYSLEELVLSSNNLATWCKGLTHGKWLWCWERLKAGGGRDDRGWNGWMASMTQCTWVSSGRWWRTEKPGMLQSMGSPGVGQEWTTEEQVKNPALLTMFQQILWRSWEVNSHTFLNTLF